MKIYQIALPLLAGTMMLSGCYDEKMSWQRPDGQGAVVSSEIPLALAEQIANYDNIKNYAAEYMPTTQIGLGASADKYLSDENYASLANANFQIFTMGNAMKHISLVGNDGALKQDAVQKAQNVISKAAESGIEVFGHNFIWHTQQNQTYLKSLIAPTMVVSSDGDIANLLPGDACDFNGGTTGGWGSWGSNKESAGVVSGVGVDGTPCLVLKNKGDGNNWDAQCAYTFDSPLSASKEYTIRFKAKSTSPAGVIQFQYQNSTSYGSQGGYKDFTVGTDWVTCEYTFTPKYDDVDRIILNFGKVSGTYYIDNIEFGTKIEDPMTNVLAGDNSDFDGGTKGSWGSWGNNSTSSISAKGQGHNSDYCLVLDNPTDGSDYYVAQCAYTFDNELTNGQTYIIQFDAKADLPASVQFATQNSSTYAGEGYHTMEVGTEWARCEYEYTCSKDGMNRILINFGKIGTKYYIDNIKFGVKKANGAKIMRAQRRATKITYTLKSAEEKRALLLNAMQTWISNAAQAFPSVKQWDVVNEPITDGTNLWRGVDKGAWGGDDKEPTETTTDGLNLNWENGTGNGHFYWGYYIGKDYGVKAFQYARQAVGDGAKLYVNEYNLETSPGKLDALIGFVNYIDANGGHVDGIGTQMHVSKSITKEQVDAMFQKLAATGKLIRISELDVAMNSSSLSAEQQQAQSDIYQMIIESYKANIPEAQRGGIVIWTLTDAADEHEYWLKNDCPNLFDGTYARKIAYKGVCDAIAGKNLGAEFSGSDWPKAYE